MSTDIHDKIRSEVERRLAIARAAVEAGRCGCHSAEDYPGDVWRASGDSVYADSHVVAGGDEWPASVDREVADHVALHDPADAIRRYTHGLKILDQHPPCVDDACAGGDCHRCVEFMPCEPLRDLAESLGIDTGGQP